MSETPFHPLFQTVEKISRCLQSHLSNFIGNGPNKSSPTNEKPRLSIASSSEANLRNKHSTLLQQKGVVDELATSIILHGSCRFSIGLAQVAKGGMGIVENHDQLLGKSANPVTKVELGRATWTFLHTLAAQFPENPTRQQKKDVKELMAILSRMYPCKECADHFKEVLRANPVQAGSQAEFSQWLCHAHNVVNRSLDKPIFPCTRVDARWGKLDCELRACDLQGTPDFGEEMR